MRRPEYSPGVSESLRLRKLPQRKPTEADRPPVTPLPGRQIKPLPGQLDLDGNETGAPPSPAESDDEEAS